jgi:hypothetical protein
VVLLLQAGNAFSWFGYGLILPFEIIYLHQFRGFSTATAGLVLGAILGAGTVATPPARSSCSTSSTPSPPPGSR